MELSNAMADFDATGQSRGKAAVFRFAFDALVRLMAPMTPHLAEELWERTGHATGIFAATLPAADPAYTHDETFDLVIQVNSKIRAREVVPAGIDPERMKAIALAHPRIQEVLEGRPPKRVVVIQNRLVNIVI
jgi:leucyl-tRNA synthetase